MKLSKPLKYIIAIQTTIVLIGLTVGALIAIMVWG